MSILWNLETLDFYCSKTHIGGWGGRRTNRGRGSGKENQKERGDSLEPSDDQPWPELILTLALQVHLCVSLLGHFKEQTELILVKLMRRLPIEVDVQEGSENGVGDLLS